jgi:hypothetical protein
MGTISLKTRSCPATEEVRLLRKIDIHPNASIGTVVRAMSCHDFVIDRRHKRPGLSRHLAFHTLEVDAHRN